MYHEDPLYHEDPWNQILIQSLKLLFAFTILYTHSSSLFFPFSINQRTIATVSNSNSIWVIDPLQLHMNHFINTLQYKNNIICLLKPIRIDNSHHIWFEKRKRNLTTWGKKNNGKSEKEKKKKSGTIMSFFVSVYDPHHLTVLVELSSDVLKKHKTWPLGIKTCNQLGRPGSTTQIFHKTGKRMEFWERFEFLTWICYVDDRLQSPVVEYVFVLSFFFFSCFSKSNHNVIRDCPPLHPIHV